MSFRPTTFVGVGVPATPGTFDTLYHVFLTSSFIVKTGKNFSSFFDGSNFFVHWIHKVQFPHYKKDTNLSLIFTPYKEVYELVLTLNAIPS